MRVHRVILVQLIKVSPVKHVRKDELNHWNARMLATIVQKESSVPLLPVMLVTVVKWVNLQHLKIVWCVTFVPKGIKVIVRPPHNVICVH